MKVVHPRCAGIDIHKESMTVCVIVDRQDGSAPQYHKRKLATHMEGIRELMGLAGRMPGDGGGDGVNGRVLETGVECAGGEVGLASM